MADAVTTPFPPRGGRHYDHDAVERFPWLVVAGYDDVHRWMDAGQAVNAAWQLRDVWESFLKFLGSAAVADRLAAAGPDDPAISPLLARLLKPQGLSLGDWPTLMELALQQTPEEQLRLPDLKHLLFPARRPRLLPLLVGGDERQSFVCWRNRRFGHGVFGRDLTRYAEDVNHWLEKLHDAFDLCRDLLSALTLESDDPAGGPLTWGGQGPLPFYHTHQPDGSGTVVCPVRLRLHEGAALDLTPLLSIQRCVVCCRWSAFYLDRYLQAKQRAFFLDLIDGHTNPPREHARLREWVAWIRPEDAAARAGEPFDPSERREPDPERFRNFQHEFEPPRYLAQRLAAFFQEHDRGILLLTGPGGVGKSWLCQGLDRSDMLPAILGRSLPMLNVTVHGPRTSGAAEVLAALAEQARRVKRWQVPPEVDAPTPHARFAGWLAALMRSNGHELGQLLVVLDGLDELPADSDVAGLVPPAAELPPGCYLVLACRPAVRVAVAEALRRAGSAGPFAEQALGLDAPEHREVLRRYVARQLGQPRLESPPLPAEWTEPLIDRAEGSFLYVFHYCRALRFGIYADLSRLPVPTEFYPAFFDHLRSRVGERLFEAYYAKVLALLAVAGEPLGLTHLAECGLERGRLVVVLDDLADLLQTRRLPWEAETLYSLGHDAIGEFLGGDAVWSERLATANRFLAELTVRRLGGDWNAVDPLDPVESWLLFSLLDRVREPGAEWASELHEWLYADGKLAAACLAHGNTLNQTDNLEHRLAAYTMATELYRDQCQRQGRTELANDLALALLSEGDALAHLGQWPEAINRQEEAIAIRRRLVEQEGRTELAHDLAIALGSKGYLLVSLGAGNPEKWHESLDCSGEAITILRPFVKQEGRPELVQSLLSTLLNAGNALSSLGEFDDAMRCYEEVVATRRRLVEQEGRTELANDLASALVNKGSLLGHLQWPIQAAACFEEAIAIRRRLVEQEGRTGLVHDLAITLANKAGTLHSLGRWREAADCYAEASTMLRRLVDQEGRGDLADDLAGVLVNQGLVLEDLNQPEEALACCGEAVDRWVRLIEAGQWHLVRALLRGLRLRLRLRLELGAREEEVPADILCGLRYATPLFQGGSPPESLRWPFLMFLAPLQALSAEDRERLDVHLGEGNAAVLRRWFVTLDELSG
jgi:tetratricopeptide (TPR) repeat protein